MTEPGDAVVVEVGNEALEHGHVRAELHGDGRMVIYKRATGERQSFEHQLDRTAAEATINWALGLARFAGDAEAAPHRPVPDEPRYRFEVRRAGSQPVTITLWRGELDPKDETYLRELGKAVERATRGQAIL